LLQIRTDDRPDDLERNIGLNELHEVARAGAGTPLAELAAVLSRLISKPFGMPAVQVYVWAANGAGCLVVTLSVSAVLLSQVEPMALILALLAALSGLAVQRLGSIRSSFSLGDAFTLSGLFMYGPEFAAMAVALNTIAMSFRLGGSPQRVVSNTAVPSLAMWMAGTLVFTMAGMPLPRAASDVASMLWPCALAVFFYFLFDSGLVAAAVALHRRTSVRGIWHEHFSGTWRGPAACGYIGWLVAVFTEAVGPQSVLTLLPLPVIAYQMFRTSLARANDQLRHLEQMNKAHASTIEAFASAVDAKDQVTHGHLRRVHAYSLAVAEELGITDSRVLRALEAAALLHDVGKIGIPEHILNKPGKLTSAEFDEMKRHVTIGAEILSTVDFPFPVVPIVRHHHENWDGTGYPDGIAGTDIPIGARILMVVDCFDALTSDRPYRPAMSVHEAFEILRARRGRMYDAAIVDRFIEIQPMLAQALWLEFRGSRGASASQSSAASTPALPALADVPPAAHADALARLLSDLLADSLTVVYEIDDCNTAIVARAAHGPGARNVIGQRLPLGQGVSGWVAANRRAIDDTDAVLDLGGLLSHSDASTLSCTCVPVTTAAGELIVSAYGPRATAAARASAIRSISLYFSSVAALRPAFAAARKEMAIAS
jgi:putative nucleotidyltransferase with HDIG domain